MDQVLKYKVSFGSQKISMPQGAQILTVQLQDNTACVWALADLAKPSAFRLLEVIATGQPTTLSAKEYIGTFQVGPTVWHLFEHL